MFQAILFFIILIFSIVIHEYSHGYAAYKLGDPTAKNARRLTLNPIAHLDLFGSVLVPLFLAISRIGFIIGWAKPVPYNPYNLRDQRYGPLKVALAGPLANLILAFVFAAISRFIPIALEEKKLLTANFLWNNSILAHSRLELLFVGFLAIIFINTLLAIFNLVPIPPLDGSKIFYTFLPNKQKDIFIKLESFGFMIVIALLFFGFFGYILLIVKSIVWLTSAA